MASRRLARRARRSALAALAALGIGAASIVPDPAGAIAVPVGKRIDLQVLVLSDGGVGTNLVTAALDDGGVPYTLVDLNAAGRPAVNAAFLSDTVAGVPRAKYQAVVLPNEAPANLSAAERSALEAFEKSFAVREVDAYVYPSAAVGLNAPTTAGTLDGQTVTVTTAAKADGFPFLEGPVTFEDRDAAVWETYGYSASPIDAAQYTPYVTAPGGGAVAGVYRGNGREQLVVSMALHPSQMQGQVLGRGIVEWATRGLHLGISRNYFTVHVDDVFAADSRWSVDANCTPGEACPPGVATTDIRMTAADVTALVNWQASWGLPLDMVFNGAGSDEAAAVNGGRDPLTDAFVANRARFRWINHTYEHLFLGCQQDFTVIPWRCQTDANGNVVWVPESVIRSQITTNRTWAQTKGISAPASELVTGEHSGLFILPQQPVDNPNLAPALTALGILQTASDNSRDPAPRKVGSATTLPRYPINVFFNVATKAEQVDEYNWLYNASAAGGSGICETDPRTTCIAPLDPATGFDSYIVPLEARQALSHILDNDPRPHYVHQSNLTEGRILYPVLERVLTEYRQTFKANTPLVSATMTSLSTVLTRQDAWRQVIKVRRGDVDAYLLNGVLTVTSRSKSRMDVPISAPAGTRRLLGGWGESYAGSLSAYEAVAAGATVRLFVP